MLVIETFWLPVDFFGYVVLLGIAIIIGIIFFLIRYTEKHGSGFDGGLGRAYKEGKHRGAARALHSYVKNKGKFRR